MQYNTGMLRAVIAIVLFGVTMGAHAHDFQQGDILVGHPWARVTPPVKPINAAVYLTIENRTDHVIRFIGASTSLTDQVSIHQTREDKGLMRMEALKNGLKVAAGDSVSLAPMGYHLMLRNLAKPLEKNDEFPLNLQFSSGHAVTVNVKVGARTSGETM